MPIGVFDSGVGGLTVLKSLRAALPNQPFLYLADTANAPYGDRSVEEITALTRDALAHLFDRGCRLILIACNTASAIALRKLQQEWLPTLADGDSRRILGVFVPMVEAISGARWSSDGHPETAAAPAGRRRLLFFATAATITSGAFPREVAARVNGVEVIGQACPGLVDAIEAGDDAKAARLAQSACTKALARCGDFPPDTAILGCTHYPLAQPAFRAALPPRTNILSQPDITAVSLARYLERRPGFEENGADARLTRFLTSGDPDAVSALAERFWDEPARFEAA